MGIRSQDQKANNGPSASPQLFEKRLVRVDGLDGDAERFGQGQRLSARAAACVNDQVEMLLRKAAQDLQGVGVAARAEFSQAAEKEFNGIGSRHASPRSVFDHDLPNPCVQQWPAMLVAARRRTQPTLRIVPRIIPRNGETLLLEGETTAA